jgi:hypothetical protein
MSMQEIRCLNVLYLPTWDARRTATLRNDARFVSLSPLNGERVGVRGLALHSGQLDLFQNIYFVLKTP